MSWKWSGGSPARFDLSGLPMTTIAVGSGPYMVTTASRDFMSMTGVYSGTEDTWWPHGDRIILARIGSDVYWNLIRFHRCAASPDAECEAPFTFDERRPVRCIGDTGGRES